MTLGTRHARKGIPLAGAALAGAVLTSGLFESSLGPPVAKVAAFVRRPVRAARAAFVAAREQNSSILRHCGHPNGIKPLCNMRAEAESGELACHSPLLQSRSLLLLCVQKQYVHFVTHS